MPAGSEALASFHGIRISGLAASPAEAKNSASLLAELTEQFRALRTATIRELVFASIAVVVGTAVTGLLWKNRTDTQLNELLRRADISRANSTVQGAERDLGKAWRIRRQPNILQAYRLTRARRVWQNGTQLRIAAEETVLAVGAVAHEPYIVLHNTQNDALSLMFKGQRLAIQYKCGVAPLVELRDALLVWACGADLGSLIVGGPQERRRLIRLPAEPAKIQMRGEKLMVLFQMALVPR
jgi:hypothetical protein